MPGWLSELLILLGLAVLAVAMASGDQVYDFFWGVQYVIINVKRTTMFWVGGAFVGMGLFLRVAFDSRPKKRRSTTQGY